MKPRSVIIGVCLTLCVATIAGVAVQGRRLEALRAKEQQLQLEVQSVETNHVVMRPSTSPSSELLRLRNQVSLLSQRQRELAAVPEENERLRARFAAARTNAANVLPPGYIRKSEARFVGYASPEDTLQTMLWAIQHHDFTNLVGSFTPAIAREMQEGMERTGQTAEQFFKGWEVVPGMSVVSRNTVSNDLVELEVAIAPGDAKTIPFRIINGEWKMDSH
jgi:hypothetical protein